MGTELFIAEGVFPVELLACQVSMVCRVVYKNRQPAKFAGFSARFCQLLSLLHESRYVEEMRCLSGPTTT